MEKLDQMPNRYRLRTLKKYIHLDVEIQFLGIYHKDIIDMEHGQKAWCSVNKA